MAKNIDWERLNWYGAIRDSSPYSRTLLFHKKGKMSTSSVLYWRYSSQTENTLKFGLFTCRAYSWLASVRSKWFQSSKKILKKKSKLIVELVAIARYRLVHMHKSILLVPTPGRDAWICSLNYFVKSNCRVWLSDLVHSINFIWSRKCQLFSLRQVLISPDYLLWGPIFYLGWNRC